jgi:hypothetical protein
MLCVGRAGIVAETETFIVAMKRAAVKLRREDG